MVNISIIIPVLNDLQAIKLTLEKLNNQTFPRDQFEIIVIDNGSTNGTWEWLSQQENILLLRETNYPHSPYSARNRGIEKAKGEIIALLDATCVPTFDWVEKGFAFLQHNPYDLFGGNVIYNFDKKISAAAIYDSIIHIQMKEIIIESGIAVTANLWIKKYVFNTMGLFLEGNRSGEDTAWTGKCTRQGYLLGYCADCLTHKFPRDLWAVLGKRFITGKGMPYVWHELGILKKGMSYSYKKLFPPKIKYMKKLLQKNTTVKYTPWLIIKIYLITYIGQIFYLLGILMASFFPEKQNNTLKRRKK